MWINTKILIEKKMWAKHMSRQLRSEENDRSKHEKMFIFTNNKENASKKQWINTFWMSGSQFSIKYWLLIRLKKQITLSYLAGGKVNLLNLMVSNLAICIRSIHILWASDLSLDYLFQGNNKSCTYVEKQEHKKNSSQWGLWEGKLRRI